MQSFQRTFKKQRILDHWKLFSTQTQSSPVVNTTKIIPEDRVISPPSGITEVRERISPWLRIGSFKEGLLSHLSTWDIIRALGVLRLCSNDFVVDNSFKLFELSLKFGPIGKWVMRKTFFDQFVGGEAPPRFTQAVNSLQQRGLTLMVAPVLEEDVEDEQASRKVYDDNLEALKNISSLASSLEKRKALLQLKPTAIMPATTLEKVSRSIDNYVRHDKGKLATLATTIASTIDSPSTFPSYLRLGNDDQIQFIEGLKRADSFVKHTHGLNSHVVVDAEFYACRPAISLVALALMAKYNGNYHVVGNTIQGYMKDAASLTKSELRTVTEEIGVNWYGKIVRGAYMDRERLLARKHGYPSPICDSYEETNISYNKAINHVLRHLYENPQRKSHLLVATHNEVSIRLAAQSMKEMGLPPREDRVSFGQIYGMADYLSTPLVDNGYHVYKSTPYGPMDKVLPYLARRASENRSVMAGTREERDMLWNELKSRLEMRVKN